MSRSDGKFPSYNKYTFNVDIWPDGYWDKSYRCTNCAAHWPQTPFFVRTPCCDANVEKTDEPPDMRWPEAVHALLTSRFNKLYAEWNEDKTDEDLSVEDFLDEIQNIEALTEDSSRT